MRQRNDREAELERRLKELEQREAALKKIADAVMKNRGAPAPAPPAEDHQARLQELEARESALKRIADVVERRRSEIEGAVRAAEERATAAEARAASLEEQLASRSSDAARVAELEGEVAQLRAELEAAQTAAPTVAAVVAEPRGRGLFGRRKRAEPPPVVEPPVLLPPSQVAHEPEPEPEPAPEPEPEPLTFEGRPTLPQLEHLADEAARRGLPQADEWLAYVRVLREHAWVDGTIPPQFDDILRDIFGAAL